MSAFRKFSINPAVLTTVLQPAEYVIGGLTRSPLLPIEKPDIAPRR